MNIQKIQNINLIWILLLSYILFSFPIYLYEIAIVFLSIVIFEIILKKITKRKSDNLFNSALNTWTGILFFLKTLNPFIFIFTAFISILWKDIFKYNWKHFINPSNLWLALTFLLFPNEVWVIWEQWERNYFFIIYILLFWFYILYKAKLIQITLSFLFTYVLWYYFIINPSIESILLMLTNISFLLFSMFMINDPKIVPKNTSKFYYWWIIWIVALLLIYFFKNSYLFLLSLTIVSLLHPFIYKYWNKFLGIIFIICISLFLVFYQWIYSKNIKDNIKIINNIDLENNVNNSISIDEKENNNWKEKNLIEFKKEKRIQKNINNDWKLFSNQTVFKETQKDINNYYHTNWLNKNSITNGDFNNDDIDDIFTITSKGLTIIINNKDYFDIYTSNVKNIVGDWNVFYRSVDYNFDWLYDIITNNNIDYNISIFINQWNLQFLEHKTNIKKWWYQWIWFSDINNDYILDILIPWNCQYVSLNNENCSDNIFYISEKEYVYKWINLDEYNNETKGPTLTTFIGDIRNEKDIYIWNDLSTPDVVYNRNKWNIILDENINEYIPVTSFQTMSCDTDDINNDWYNDIFCSEMLFMDNIYNNKINTTKCSLQSNLDDIATCDIFNKVSEYVNTNNLSWCLWIDNLYDINLLSNNTLEILWFQKGLCMTQIINNTAYNKLDPNLCNKINNNIIRNKCYNKINLIKKENKDNSKWINNIQSFPRQKSSNILLLWSSEWKFKNVTNSFWIERSDWSWNANIFDINNDNFLDIFVVNGSSQDVRFTENHLFKNNEWKSFEKVTDSWLELINPTYVYSYWNFDWDLDNDIFVKDLMWNIIFYQNNSLNNSNNILIKTTINNNWINYKNIPNIKYYFYDKDNNLLFKRERKLSGWYNSMNKTDLLFTYNSKIDYIKVRYEDIESIININENNLGVIDNIIKK